MPRKSGIATKDAEMSDHDYRLEAAVMKNDIKHINDTLVRIETKFDAAITSFVTNEQLAAAQLRADEKHAAQDRAIKALEDWNLWAQRIILGAVLTAIIGVVIVAR